MSELARGGCLCGGFHYRFPREAVITTLHCHCTDCQRSTGSGKATILLVPKAVLSREGELKTFTVKGTEGSSVSRGFCPECGSPLLSFVEEMPDLLMVKAGSLEDSSWVSADLSCWASSAQPWLPVDDTCPASEQNPNLQG